MLREPTDSERLMAYSEVGKVINEASTGRAANMFAVVRGIHDESGLAISIGTHVFELSITGIEDLTNKPVVVCEKCGSFKVPTPLDPVGEALMHGHLATCKA